MALIPPTYDEYVDFIGEEFPDDMIIRIEDMLTQATDAFWAFTGLTEYPADPQASRVTRYAIMDLTAWITSQNEHRAEINSPFSSERIGSYSYSKMQQAKDGITTGIYWLDLYFRSVNGSVLAHLSTATSENVFSPHWLTYEQSEGLRGIERHDPPAWGI